MSAHDNVHYDTDIINMTFFTVPPATPIITDEAALIVTHMLSFPMHLACYVGLLQPCILRWPRLTAVSGPLLVSIFASLARRAAVTVAIDL